MSTYAHVDDRWGLCDLDTMILESDALRVVVTPGQGGRIHQLKDKVSGCDLLWTHPRRDPYQPRFGERHSGRLGGIDEYFPTSWACRYRDDELVAHGDYLTMPWRCDVLEWGERKASIRLWCNGIIVPVRIERYMTLLAGERALRMRHRIVNLTSEPYDFLWSLHPCFDGSRDYRIDLPAGTVYEDTSQFHEFKAEQLSHYEWPWRPWKDSGAIDMRHAPPPDWPWFSIHYAMLREGWLAYTYTGPGVGLGVAFDRTVFPVAAIWTVRGASGRYLTAVTPWTGWPLRLSDAVERGTAAQLPGKGVLETETCWVVYTGLSEVSEVTLDGQVVGKRS